VVKTVRLRLNCTATLLNTHPNLKVVHLIRDPRQQVQSRITSFEVQKSIADIPKLCGNVKGDLELGSQLSPSLYRLVRL